MARMNRPKPIFFCDGGRFVLLKIGDSELGFMKPGLKYQAPLLRPAFGGRGVWMAIEVEDAQAEYQRLKEMNVTIAVELRDEPWGDRHFAVLGPSGVALDIVQRLTD